jgi:alkanesulfonate monooxygenase SsuD/methylene tetrahydromethanopterin reductase-like flavin-dependent oxidoreductase (luciferase family)
VLGRDPGSRSHRRSRSRRRPSGAFDTLWVGDSLLAKPRLEAVALLSALAGATSRLRLAVGCMATFVHRHPLLFAQQWASLDVLSGGRALLAVCLGGPDEQSPAQALEHAVMGVRSSERVGRLERRGSPSFEKSGPARRFSHRGEFYQFEGVKIEPRPVQQPCPDLDSRATRPASPGRRGQRFDTRVERGFRRVARFADGWNDQTR